LGKQENNVNISNIWEMYEPEYPEYETECHRPVAQLGFLATRGQQHIKMATPDINYEF
jgi:hypothetical protein